MRKTFIVLVIVVLCLLGLIPEIAADQYPYNPYRIPPVGYYWPLQNHGQYSMFWSSPGQAWGPGSSSYSYWDARFGSTSRCGMEFFLSSETRPGASFSIFGISGITRLPLSGQRSEDFCKDNILSPAATAVVRVIIPKTTQNGQWPYYDWKYTLNASFASGGANPVCPMGLDMDYIDCIPGTCPYPNWGRFYFREDFLADAGVADMKQTDPRWANAQYSNVAGATHKGWSCFLTSFCNNMYSLSVPCNPLEVGDWLRQQPDGFVGLRVNGLAVVRWARVVKGVNLGYIVRGMSVNEALQRKDVRVQDSVRNSGHWVDVVGYLINEVLRVLHRIHDPNGARNYKLLEDYAGYSLTDTRVIYLKNVPSGSSQSSSESINSSDLMTATTQTTETSSMVNPAEFGLSAIALISESSVELTLLKDGVKVAESQPEYLENSETGEVVTLPVSIEYSDAGPGVYTVKVKGAPGTSYLVKVFKYDDKATMAESSFEGTIGSEGSSLQSFQHSTKVFINSVGKIKDLPIGTNIILTCGIATADIGYQGFYVQPISTPVPAVYVGGAYGYAGVRIEYLEGTIGQINGKKCIYSSGIILYESPHRAKPIGVSLKQLPTTGGIYVRSWGRITDISYDDTCHLEYIVIDNVQRVYCRDTYLLSLGQLVAINGVYHYDGNFYTGVGAVQILSN